MRMRISTNGLVAFILVGATLLLAPAERSPRAGPQEPATPDQQSEPTEEPSALKSDLQEKAEVRILQLEVTAWPKKGDAQACLDITRDDFEVRIGGQPREVLAADRLGDLGTPVIAPPASAPATPSAAAMRYVIVFDTWHLDLWWETCGRTTPLAFSWVREMLQDRFQPGDRVMLATLSNLPQFFTPWLDNREAALQALAEMEMDPRVLIPHRDHRSDDAWLAGWKLLLESLGNAPGRKQLIYLGDDWDPRWVPGTVLGLPAVAARAQKNHVLIQSVDTIASCRDRIGPAMSTPMIIANLAEHSGGHLFQGGQTVSTAVATLRKMQSCRFLLSVGAQSRDRRKNGLRMHAIIRRPGFRLAAPERVEDPRRGATEEEKLQALFLLPRWDKGLFAQADLWPLRPTGKKDRWNALLIARVRKTDTATWPLDIEEIIVDAVVYRRSKVFAEYSWTLREAHLAAFRDSPTGRAFSFPVTVPSGTITVAVTAKATGFDIGATSRTTPEVPRPPEAGEIHPWFLVDQPVSIGGRLSLAPSTRSSFPVTHPPILLGFGCRPASGDQPIGRGKLVQQDGSDEREVDVRWLEQDDEPAVGRTACGWFIGKIQEQLITGLWDFYPPSFSDGIIDTPALTFRVGN